MVGREVESTFYHDLEMVDKILNKKRHNSQPRFVLFFVCLFVLSNLREGGEGRRESNHFSKHGI